MKTFSLFVLCLFFVSACSGADVTMREENTYDKEKEYVEPEDTNEEFVLENEEEQWEREEEFSLVKEREIMIVLNSSNISITLLGTTNRSAGFLIDGRRISIGMGSPLRRDAYQITLLETTTKTIPVPRKSWMDISLSKGVGTGERFNVRVGETHEVSFGEETVPVSLEFVGRNGEEYKGRLHIGEYIVYAGEKEEEYWEDGLSLYVHNVFFINPSDYDLTDGARITFIER